MRLFLPLVLILLALPLSAAEFYVSPTGNDAAAGTKAAPFRTLARARDAIRTLKPRPACTVFISPGVYSIERTLELGEQDCGTAAAPIIYRGADGARLSGGKVVAPSAFTPVTDPAVLNRLEPAARGKVLQVDLKALGVSDFGGDWPVRFQGYAGWPELFVDGSRMTIARWPNSGYARIEKVLDPGSKPRNAEKPDRGGKFVYSGDRPERWPQDQPIYLKGYWCFQWFDEVIRVAGIDTATKTVTMAAPHVYGLGGVSGNMYYALNLLEELDAPREYFIDRATGKLYFYPPTPLKAQEITLSTLNAPLVSLKNASHVRFEGLVFEASRNSAVQMQDCVGVVLAGCTIRNVATEAVGIRGGSDCGLQSCDLYNLGSGGVTLSGGDRQTLTPCNHFVDNCHIHDFIQVSYNFQSAIMMNGVGCRASHNLIHDTPQQAMGYGGNDHKVEFNEVHDVCLDADDNGVIHQGRDWTWRGNVIRYNFFHHVNSGPACSNSGVYLDDMESGVEVVGNVIYRVPRGHLVGGGRDNLLENNIMVDCPIPVSIDNRAMGWAKYHVGTTMKDGLARVPYKEEPWASRYPKLVGIWEDEPGTPKGNVFRRNLMVRCGKPQMAKEVTQFGIIENNLETQDDPGFVDPQRLNFNLREDSPVFQKIPGFQKIPFDQIGLYVDQYREALPVKTPVLNPEPQAFVEELTVTLDLPRGSSGVIRYTLDGTEPTPQSPLYAGPLKLTKTVTIKAVAFPTARSVTGCSSQVVGTFKALQLGPTGGIYLSDLPFTDALAHGGVKRDLNYAGSGQLSLQGAPLDKGILMCPETTPEGGRGHATWDLAGNLRRATKFSAVVGIDGAMTNGSVTFVVEVFRGQRWEKLYDSGVMKPGEAKQVEVDISGSEKLRLSTTDAGDNIHADHAVWGKARLQ